MKPALRARIELPITIELNSRCAKAFICGSPVLLWVVTGLPMRDGRGKDEGSRNSFVGKLFSPPQTTLENAGDDQVTPSTMIPHIQQNIFKRITALNPAGRHYSTGISVLPPNTGNWITLSATCKGQM